MTAAGALARTASATASWPDWYAQWRQVQAERFDAWGLPSKRLENWKYTPLARRLEALQPLGESALQPEDVAALALPGGAARAVFVDGRYRPDLSMLDTLEGRLELTRLGEARADQLDRFRALLGDGFPGRDETPAALAAGRADDGAVLAVEQVAGSEAPVVLDLVFLWTEAAGEGCANLHHLVALAPGATLRLNEIHLALGRARSLANQLTTVSVGSRARLELLRAQALGDAGRLVSRTDVVQERDSRVEHAGFDLGGALVRHDLNARLVEPGAEIVLKGVYALAGERHVDNHTRVEHLASNTRSEEFYKGVLDGRSRGVFNGKVFVAAGVCAIDAAQVNRNLLLSRQAEIDTKPELVIYADDVKCAHGATVGQLDERQLYYLRSRGIARADARAMLVDAFCREIVDQVDDSGWRRWIGARLVEALPSRAPGAGADAAREVADSGGRREEGSA